MITSRVFICGLTALCLTTANIASGQETVESVDAKSDWGIFSADSPKECFVVSAPVSFVNTRGGKVVEANRSDIRLFVTYRPSDNVRGEVSFTGGYPFKSDSKVKIQVGSSSYDMFTDGEWAWPGSTEDDNAIRTSLKRGANAILTGVSGRGTVTTDTFSLVGFTAALAEAEKRCQ